MQTLPHSRLTLKPRRRALIQGAAVAALSLGWAPPAAPAARQTPMPGARSLSELLDRAAARREPVVVLFSRTDCPWCEALRRDQMVHLARDARTRAIQVVEFDVADNRPFTAVGSGGPDFAAAKSGADLAVRLRIGVTPTVVFLGPTKELAERLIGYPSRDFYGAYLDERIASARAAIGSTRL